MMIIVHMPYTPHASKNRKFAYRGHKFRNPLYAKFVEDVILKTNNQCALQQANFRDHQKVRIDLMLVKTSKMTRTDASNFLEAVCDGVKQALGIDDCWFAGSFDWQAGDEPEIIFSISQ